MNTAEVTSPQSPIPRPRWRIPVAIVALLFGAATIKSGGSVLFIDGPDRVAAGDYVPFVLWFNFIAGFFYIAAAIGIVMWKSCVAKLAALIAVLTVLVFAALGAHILMNGAFEMRTVYAMTMRSFVWLTFAFLLTRAMRPNPFA